MKKRPSSLTATPSFKNLKKNKSWIPFLLSGGIFPVLAFIIIFQFTSCKPEAYEFPFENAGGYVIGKETCNADTTKDYWLIDLSIFPLPNTYGDTLTLNGVRYHHVIKTAGLSSQLKYVGAKADLDFNISTTPLNTLGCTVQNPQTYSLKVLDVIGQAEIR